MRRDKDGKTIRNDVLAPYQTIPHPWGVNIEIGENRGADTRSSLVDISFINASYAERSKTKRGKGGSNPACVGWRKGIERFNGFCPFPAKMSLNPWARNLEDATIF
jgi:hypothetical protein